MKSVPSHTLRAGMSLSLFIALSLSFLVGSCTTPTAPKQSAATRDEWLAPRGVHRGPDGNDIDHARVIPVSAANRQVAISMLLKKPFVRLTDKQVVKLLGVPVSTDSVVARVIADREAEAARMGAYLDGKYAGPSRQAALDARNRTWKLTPYLVRGVLSREDTGRFFASLKQNGELWVQHQSLGRSYVPPTKVPVIIYLEQPPSAVFVTTSMAE